MSKLPIVMFVNDNFILKSRIVFIYCLANYNFSILDLDEFHHYLLKVENLRITF